MKTKREILAAILEGDIEPLLKYRDQQEGCIYVFNCFSDNSVAYCIYPDMTVETMGAGVVREMVGKMFAGGEFDFDYHDFDLEEMERDLQINPAKYYQPRGRHFFA